MLSNFHFVSCLVWTSSVICLTCTAPVPDENLLNKFIRSFGEKCKVLGSVVLPSYGDPETNNQQKYNLKVPLEVCTISDKSDPAVPICNEAFELISNLSTCAPDIAKLNDFPSSVPPTAVNISVQIDNVCDGFSENEKLFTHVEFISFKLADKQLCSLICQGKVRKACSFLLWGYEVQAAIHDASKKAVDSNTVLNDDGGKPIGGMDEKKSGKAHSPGVSSEEQRKPDHTQASSVSSRDEYEQNLNTVESKATNGKPLSHEAQDSDSGKQVLIPEIKQNIQTRGSVVSTLDAGSNDGDPAAKSQDSGPINNKDVKMRISAKDDIQKNSASIQKSSTSANAEIQESPAAANAEIQESPAAANGDLQKSSAAANGDLQKSSTSANSELQQSSTSANGDLHKSSTSASGELQESSASANGDLQKSSTSDSDELQQSSTSANGDLHKSSTSASGELQESSASANGDLQKSSTSASGELQESSASAGADLQKNSASASDELWKSSTSNNAGIHKSFTIDAVAKSVSSKSSEISGAAAQSDASDGTEKEKDTQDVSVQSLDGSPDGSDHTHLNKNSKVPVDGNQESSPVDDKENDIIDASSVSENVPKSNVLVETNLEKDSSLANSADNVKEIVSSPEVAEPEVALESMDETKGAKSLSVDGGDDNIVDGQFDGESNDSDYADVDTPLDNQLGQSVSTKLENDAQVSQSLPKSSENSVIKNIMPAAFPEQEDAHFFFYFITIIIFAIGGYVLFHNKQKIFALIIEGRHERRRRSGASYRKLETK